MKKCPNPVWRDMNKYLKRYAKECLKINFTDDLKNHDNFLKLYNAVMNKTETIPITDLKTNLF